MCWAYRIRIIQTECKGNEKKTSLTGRDINKTCFIRQNCSMSRSESMTPNFTSISQDFSMSPNRVCLSYSSHMHITHLPFRGAENLKNIETSLWSVTCRVTQSPDATNTTEISIVALIFRLLLNNSDTH